jgi:integrase
MNALTTLPSPAAAPVALVVTSQATREMILNSEAVSTRKAYASDFRIFTAWCAERGLTPLPAQPEAVANWITEAAFAGTKSSTLGRRVAALRYMHRLANLEPPTSSELVKKALRGCRRQLGSAPVKKAAATADLVRAMADTCEGTLTGKRDRALLAMGLAGAFRRSELVALTIADLAFEDDGVRITIRKSKTDQEGHGHIIVIPRGGKLRPVAALQEWLEEACITSGPIFRAVYGRAVSPDALCADAVGKIVKKRALAAGLDPANLSAHSLRSGFLTSAARAGASIFKMREVSRHKSMDTLSGYVRDANLYNDHAGSSFL